MKVCFVTGTRAEFGLQAGLMAKVRDSEQHELQLVVTGTHLVESFGHTINFIRQQGFDIDAEVTEVSAAVTNVDVARQIGAGVGAFAETFTTLKPDLLVILGDRFEMLSAALAAFYLEIPIVHIHGGEVTTGSFDDTTRHLITKLSSVHLVSHERYRQRVIQLGENPETVHVVGALGIDELAGTPLMSRESVEIELGYDLGTPLFLVTYHPVTRGPKDAENEVHELLIGLDAFPDATVIFTLPNGDPGYEVIIEAVKNAVSAHKNRWHLESSLGQVKYWSLMALADAVVGNSSSGILEAPSLFTPTVNVGTRQNGRIMADTVVSCDPVASRIEEAIGQVLEKDFMNTRLALGNPLGGPGATAKIYSLLDSLTVGRVSEKVFYDLPQFTNGAKE